LFCSVSDVWNIIILPHTITAGSQLSATYQLRRKQEKHRRNFVKLASNIHLGATIPASIAGSENSNP
jgi:hypothetical protein